MTNQSLIIPSEKKTSKDGILQLSPITLKPEYAQEWNERSTDFMVLSRNGEILRNTLYRVGGLNHGLKVGVDKYFMLLKYTEDVYTTEFIKECYPNNPKEYDIKRRKHLKSQWVILDIHGNEKVVIDDFHSPYLVNRNCPIYSVNKRYYNIETGYFYGYSYSSMKSSKYLFLDVSFEKEIGKKGIIKIDMNDGTFELFE